MEEKGGEKKEEEKLENSQNSSGAHGLEKTERPVDWCARFEKFDYKTFVRCTTKK